jgi:hypothetical protein
MHSAFSGSRRGEMEAERASPGRRALKLALVFGPAWAAAFVVASFILTLD